MNPADLRTQLARLEAIYGTSRAAQRDRTAYEREWTRALGYASSDDLERAVSAYLSSEAEHWPKPGQLLGWIRRHPAAFTPRSDETEYQRWESDYGADIYRDDAGELRRNPCPVCGVTAILGGPGQGRIRMLHVADAHEKARIPCTSWSDELEAFYAPMRPVLK